jgi:hypothetical protein
MKGLAVVISRIIAKYSSFFNGYIPGIDHKDYNSDQGIVTKKLKIIHNEKKYMKSNYTTTKISLEH